MAIPAKPALNLFAEHRLVMRISILHKPGEQMAVMRQTVREWRAVIENELPGSLAVLHRFPENVVFIPEIEDFFLQLGEIGVRINVRVVFFLAHRLF